MYFPHVGFGCLSGRTVNAAAVAKHHGRESVHQYVAMTPLTDEHYRNTASPQQKLHWLAEQALNWSGLPVGTCGDSALEGFLLILTPIRLGNQIRSGSVREGKTCRSQ